MHPEGRSTYRRMKAGIVYILSHVMSLHKACKLGHAWRRNTYCARKRADDLGLRAVSSPEHSTIVAAAAVISSILITESLFCSALLCSGFVSSHCSTSPAPTLALSANLLPPPQQPSSVATTSCLPVSPPSQVVIHSIIPEASQLHSFLSYCHPSHTCLLLFAPSSSRRFHSTHPSKLTLPPKQSKQLPSVKSTRPLLSSLTRSRSEIERPPPA